MPHAIDITRLSTPDRLPVFQVSEGRFYVEADGGTVCYRVVFTEDEASCTCQDWVRSVRTDPDYTCPHLLAVMTSHSKGNAKKVDFLEKRKPKLDDRFIKEIEGREFVLYSGLLDLAHQKGLRKIELQVLQYPSSENGSTAIIQANVESACGDSFSDIGDANPSNCDAMIAKHLIRMASTRAKARALRDFTNIGMTCLDELGSLNDVMPGDPASQGSSGIQQPRQETPTGVETSNQSSTGTNGGIIGSTTSSGTSTQGTTTGTNGTRRTTRTASAKGNGTEAATQGATSASTPPNGNGSNGNAGKQPSISAAQRRAILNISQRRGMTTEDLTAMTRKNYSADLDSLTSAHASQLIRFLQQPA